MKLTKQVRDCARLAIRDGYACLWVTIAGNATWECGDVYDLSEISEIELMNLHAEVRKRPSKEPMAPGIIRYADMLKRYAKEAETENAAQAKAAEQAFTAEKQAEKAARESAARQSCLRAYRLYHANPTDGDLARMGLDRAGWDVLARQLD